MLTFKKQEFILSFIFTILVITGELDLPAGWNFLPVKEILMALLFVYLLFSLKSLSKKVIPLFVLIFLYIGYSLIVVLYKGINFQDYIIAYITFYYFIILLFFVNKTFFGKAFFNKFYLYLLVAFFIKYFLVVIVFNKTRPGLFIENNFELMFISLLLIVYGHINQKIKPIYLFLTGAIFLLSESRSGIGILMFVIFMFYFKKEYFKIKYLGYYIVAFGLGLFGVYIIVLRSVGGVESIDRFRFLLVFIEEVQYWGVKEWLIGTPTLTALSGEGCEAMSFYRGLFSFKGDGTCYSVVFHSFILRVIFDHGILGGVFIVYIINKILAIKGYSFKERLTFIGVFVLNGLSVSSVNSIFGVFGLFLALTININSIKKETVQ